MFIWAPPWAGFKNWILEVLELVWLAPASHLPVNDLRDTCEPRSS